MTVDEQLAYLTKGCVDVVRAAELRPNSSESAATGRPLVVKVGFDPTAPDLHLGHTVLIRKMKHFQDLGHRVVFVVGAFTALIGDPTGRSKTRPPLTPEEIAAERRDLQDAGLQDPRPGEDGGALQQRVARAARQLRLGAARGALQRRADAGAARFQEALRGAASRSRIHEFLYPLAQAYDSVSLKADVELGGTDQLFNLNVGRDLMPAYGLEPQVVMTTPLLEGLDGVEKMSKSLGNYVGVTEPPSEMFGKLMSISDELMWRYYVLLTDLDAGSDRRAPARRRVGRTASEAGEDPTSR